MRTVNTPSAIRVTLGSDAFAALERRLADEITAANAAVSDYVDDDKLYDFAWSLYEQQSQQGISRDTPRYGSADYTSPIPMEHVDTLSARASKALFTSLLWVVEGIGDDEQKAPLVERYLQWRQEQMRLQSVARKVFQSAFVERGAVFEVNEDADFYLSQRVVRAAIQRDEMGNRLLGEDGRPVPLIGADGEPVQAPDGTEWVEVVVERPSYRRSGASVRRRSMKDFRFLPAHAGDDQEVWARAVRRWERWEDLKAGESRGEYAGVDRLASVQERSQGADHDRSGVTVSTPPTEATNELEIWRVQFYADLDGDGKRFYVADVHETQAVVLNLRVDPLGMWRTVYVNPYPCAYSPMGYSMVLTKLLTTALEHTAWRNMNADRGTLKSNAPMKRLIGSAWDPEVQPLGAGRVVDVNDMRELEPMSFEDMTPQAMQKEQQCVQDAQRIIGINDIAVGQTTRVARTLGENRMATQGSFLRTDDPIGNIQEAMEELGRVIHAVEVLSLRENPSGIRLPSSLSRRLRLEQATVTADMIDGQFLFKPRGSVDDADPQARQAKFQAMWQFLGTMAKVNPNVASRLSTPEMADTLMQWLVDEFRPRDVAPFLTPVQPTPAGRQAMPAGMPGPVGPVGPGGPPGAPMPGIPPELAQLLSGG